MRKIAPDANANDDRTISLYYCGMEQGYVAYLTERLGPGVTKRTRICKMDDAVSTRYEKELETLLSWGEIMVQYPIRDGIWHGLGLGIHEYRLHDTPQVRALLKKIDSEHCRRLHNELERLVKEAHDAGYIIGKWSPSQDYEWTDLPKDLRTRIYKNHE
jgi:hypothetical protein